MSYIAKVDEETLYSLPLAHNCNLTDDTTFQIDVPPGFTFPNSPCGNGSWICLNVTTTSIRVKSASTLDYGFTEIFYIMKNPPSAVNVSALTFSVTAYENDSVIVFQAKVYVAFSLTPGSATLKVTPSTTELRANNVVYQFNLTNEHELTRDNKVSIVVPDELDVSSARLLKFMIDGASIPSASMTVNRKELVFNNALSSLNGTHTFTITISGVSNPESKASLTFSVAFLLGSAQVDTGTCKVLFGVVNSEPVTITSSSSLTNGEITEISFVVAQSSGLPPNNATWEKYSLVFEYPSDISFCNCSGLDVDTSYGEVTYFLSDQIFSNAPNTCEANINFTNVETNLGFKITCLNPSTNKADRFF